MPICPTVDGCSPTVDRLVDALDQRFEADGVLRPLFGRDLSNERRKQERVFAEWLGGPPRYSESAWAALHQPHEDLPITPGLADRWLGHLSGALHYVVKAGFVKTIQLLLQAGADRDALDDRGRTPVD